ncbi:MAG: hypothetical protein AB7P69_16200 [Candidatus Binatia bacterium]
MGKRVPPDERPFNPVEAALVRSVLASEPPVDLALVTTQVTSAEPQEDARGEHAVSIDGQQTWFTSRQQNALHALQIEKLSREKRVLLTQVEEREVERIVARLAAELSTPVKLSHLLRACVTLIRHAESQIADQARQVGSLTRPANGNLAALAEFEHRFAKILSAAFRDTARLR